MSDSSPSDGLLLRLRDGHPVLLRPMSAADRGRLSEGLARLSARSRYQRFFFRLGRFSEEQLSYLTQVDQVDHVAWSALDPATPGLPGLGVGRFVRSPAEPSLAEWALTVVDSHQRRGLGTLLAGVLYLTAQARNVTVLRASVLPGNWAVTNWLQKLGGRVKYCPDVWEVDLPVGRERLPATAERFAQLVEELRQGSGLDF